ncbi:MAG: preprotein translocase subunit SecG [Solirubrobacterales bacterium]|nr:preprotein translocase subunit SecG [Solirubrobacterales bacterium]OJU95421.1 MAG: preprotein translocase subunit SecG [Solirubrobacterales bacterium 67-14]
MYTIMAIIQVLLAVLLIFLVLLHSGKDAGLSGAFGIGGGGSSVGGGSMVEQNLDRATIVTAVLFTLNTILLIKL